MNEKGYVVHEIETDETIVAVEVVWINSVELLFGTNKLESKK